MRFITSRTRHGSAVWTGVCQLIVMTLAFCIVPPVTSTTQPGSTSHFAWFGNTVRFMFLAFPMERCVVRTPHVTTRDAWPVVFLCHPFGKLRAGSEARPKDLGTAREVSLVRRPD